jgi:hypothetical protein
MDPNEIAKLAATLADQCRTLNANIAPLTESLPQIASGFDALGRVGLGDGCADDVRAMHSAVLALMNASSTLVSSLDKLRGQLA